MKNKNQKSESIGKRMLSFFMTVMLVLAIVPCGIFSSAAASLKIPSGAKYYNGHMYYVYKSETTWKKAKKLCESKGGHLATITSKGEQKFIESLFKQRRDGVYYIGAYDKSYTSTDWEPAWITKERFSYSNWMEGEPTGRSGKAFYSAIFEDDFKWTASQDDADDSGYDCLGYICEWEVGMPTRINQTSASSSSVTVSWKDNDLVSKYIVYYYDTSAKKYMKYKTVTKTSITINGLSSATTYKIAISSVFSNNGKTFTTPKTAFNAVTLPGKTKNLKIEDKISLTWSNVKGADGYVVYSFDSDTKKWEVFDTVKKNSCKIGKKFGSAAQQFKVRAFKRSTDGEKFYGGYSNTVKR